MGGWGGRIPREYMTGTKEFLGPDLPDAPLLVFINSRSGGRAGPRLKEVLCHALGHTQVPPLRLLPHHHHCPAVYTVRVNVSFDPAQSSFLWHTARLCRRPKCRALGRWWVQVYDLQDHRPGKVLRRIFDNLAQAEAAGDARASYFRRHLRILAAGGDGTVAWLLGTIADLKLDPPPHVAVRRPSPPHPDTSRGAPIYLMLALCCSSHG